MLVPFEEWMKDVLGKCKLIWKVARSPLPDRNMQEEQTSTMPENTQTQNKSNNIQMELNENFQITELLQKKEELQAQIHRLQTQNQQAEMRQSQMALFGRSIRNCRKTTSSSCKPGSNWKVKGQRPQSGNRSCAVCDILSGPFIYPTGDGRR